MNLINVDKVLSAIGSYEKFPTVDDLYNLVESLNTDQQFSVKVAGHSQDGNPLHHIRFSEGGLKVLLLGYPHIDEPVGGLTIISLIDRLKQGCPELVGNDIEWNIVPCIDPDGLRLNEGWFSPPFSLKKFMRHFHKQNSQDQVEGGFPIAYKNLQLDNPASVEVSALMDIIHEIKPDFFFSLHNAMIGGGYFYLNQDIDRCYQKQLLSILADYNVPAQISPIADVTVYGDAVFKLPGCQGWYDYFEQHVDAPSNYVHGATSYDYLESVVPNALSFLAEIPYMSYANMGSSESTGCNLKQLMLRADADSKYIKSVILQEWVSLKDDVNKASPFYRKVLPHIEHGLSALHETLSEFPLNTAQSILQNHAINRIASIDEKFKVCVRIPYAVLCHSYAFVRLLKDSEPSPKVVSAIDRLDVVFDQALSDITQHINASDLTNLDINILVKVQLGSGLTVLNSLIAKRQKLSEGESCNAE